MMDKGLAASNNKNNDESTEPIGSTIEDFIPPAKLKRFKEEEFSYDELLDFIKDVPKGKSLLFCERCTTSNFLEEVIDNQAIKYTKNSTPMLMPDSNTINFSGAAQAGTYCRSMFLF